MRRGFQIESGNRYAGSLEALGPIFDIEIHGLTLGQNLESFRLDGRKMYKNILASISRRYKTESLGFIEPFNRSARHFDLPF